MVGADAAAPSTVHLRGTAYEFNHGHNVVNHSQGQVAARASGID
jgi:hypothetical protein